MLLFRMVGCRANGLWWGKRPERCLGGQGLDVVQAFLIRSGIAGHVDRGYLGMGLPDRVHHGKPVLPGHLDIGNDDIRQDVVKGGIAGPTVLRGKNRLMILAKNGFDNGQNDTGIIDNKNFHTRTPSHDQSVMTVRLPPVQQKTYHYILTIVIIEFIGF